VTTRWWRRYRVARRTAIGLAVLGLLLAIFDIGAVWRASWVVNQLLHDWAAGAIAQQSDSVYQFDVSRARFNPALRRVTVDSITLTTNRAINERRPASRPGLHLVLHDCTISGVHFISLIRRAGLIASSLGCLSGSLMLEVPRRAPTDAPAGPSPAPAGPGGERVTVLVFQQSLRPPSYAPRIRIGRVFFPRLALEVRLPRAAGGATRLLLERLQWSMADLVIDPSDTVAATRPLFSRAIELAGRNFTAHPDQLTAVRVGLLRTSLTDSTLEVHDVGYGPSVSGAEFLRSQRYRHDLTRLSVGRITARGIDLGAFIIGQGVRARRIEVDSFRIDVTSDKRRPEGPPGHHKTPQQWIADLDETLSLDSLLVRNGQVVYREHAVGRDGVGVITFARIEAAAAGVRHFAGRRTSGDPMTLTARAQFQNAGQLDVRFVVPLDAPRFDMGIRGTLGAMPTQALNPFVMETNALMIGNGQVAGIDFSIGVRNGVATGTITPRYSDLSITVTRSGAGGVMGSGGILGGAARGIANFAAGLKVRAENPDRPGSAPLIGPIRHTFMPDETLIKFVWSSVRDGLLLVVKR
jgi:hypothetical protein